MGDGRYRGIAIATRAGVALLVLAAGVGAFIVLFVTRPKAPEPQDLQLVREVRTMSPQVIAVRRQWVGYGAGQAMDSADVPTQVSAIVSEIPESIQPGARVERGTFLAQLDPVDFQQQLDLIAEQLNGLDARLEQLDIEESSWEERLRLAETEEQVSRADLDRLRELLASGDATEVEVDRAEALLSLAQRAVSTIREEVEKAGPRRLGLRADRQALVVQREIAQRNLDRTRIESPLAGFIESVDIEVGEQVIAGETIARIINLERIEVPIQLPAAARLYVREGDRAAIIPAGAPDRRWEGEVARIGPRDDEESRTFSVYVDVMQDPAAAGALTPGLYVQALVESGAEEMRMVVPRQALSRGRLLVVEDGRVTPRAVEIAFFVSGKFPQLGVPEEGYWAALSEPLPEGTSVIVNGATDIAPGTRVRGVSEAVDSFASNGRGRGDSP